MEFLLNTSHILPTGVHKLYSMEKMISLLQAFAPTIGAAPMKSTSARKILERGTRADTTDARGRAGEGNNLYFVHDNRVPLSAHMQILSETQVDLNAESVIVRVVICVRFVFPSPDPLLPTPRLCRLSHSRHIRRKRTTRRQVRD